MPPLLAAVDWVGALLIVAFLFISVMMVLVILIQRPQGGGLSGAFGSGAGSSQTAFGARTGDALTVATIAIFVVFLAMAGGLNYYVRPAQAGPAAPTAAPAETTGAGEPGAEAPAASQPAAPPEAPVSAPAEPAPRSAEPSPDQPASQPTSEPPQAPAGDPAPGAPPNP